MTEIAAFCAAVAGVCAVGMLASMHPLLAQAIESIYMERGLSAAKSKRKRWWLTFEYGALAVWMSVLSWASLAMATA